MKGTAAVLGAVKRVRSDK